MSNLYAMNICIYIFLFHFVANKEQFFLEINNNEQKKLEFTYYNNTKSSITFYNKLKQDKTIILSMTYAEDMYFQGHIQNIELNEPINFGGIAFRWAYSEGQIIAYDKETLRIYINHGSMSKNCDIIGKINDLKNMNTIFGTNPIILKFILVEEEKETQKVNEAQEENETQKVNET